MTASHEPVSVATEELETAPSLNTWELLPYSEDTQLAVRPSFELVPLEPAQKGLVAFEGVQELQLINHKDALDNKTIYDLWTRGNISTCSTSSNTIICTDPEMRRKVTENNRDHGRISIFKAIVGFLAVDATTAIGGAIGGGYLAAANGMGMGDVIVAGIIGAAAGLAAPFPVVLGYQWADEKIEEIVHNRGCKALSAEIKNSPHAYVIPNKGQLTDGLGEDVRNVLADVKDPQEVLTKQIAPLVTAIMHAEVELAEIEPELRRIGERKKVLGVLLDQDKTTQGELTQKKKSLTAVAAAKRIELQQIRQDQIEQYQDELKLQSFRAKLLEISPEKLTLAPKLQEFCGGVGHALEAAYEPEVSVAAEKAIDDLVAALETLDDETLVQPVYTALRKKWANAGIQIPEYTVLQDQIMKKRELR